MISIDTLHSAIAPSLHGMGGLWHLRIRLVGDDDLDGQVHKLHPYVLQHSSEVIMNMYACIQQGSR